MLKIKTFNCKNFIKFVVLIYLLITVEHNAICQSYNITQTLTTATPSGLPQCVTSANAGKLNYYVSYHGNSTSCSDHYASSIIGYGDVNYQSYNFTNTISSSLCVSVSLSNDGSNPNAELFPSLFNGFFDENSLSAGFSGGLTGYSGYATNQGTQSFSAHVFPSQNFSIVVSDNNNSLGATYQLSLSIETTSSCKYNPLITSQPKSQTVNYGQPLTLSVGAIGSDLIYKWGLYGPPNWGIGSFGTNSSLTVTTSGEYYVWVTNSDSCGWSNSSQSAYINIICPQTLDIVTHPLSDTINLGEMTTLSVSGVGTGISYLWNLNNSTTPSITVSSPGNYFVTLTDDCGHSKTSNTAKVTLICPQALSITSQPQSSIINLGETATISVTALGTGLNYSWNLNNATTPSITLSTAGNYFVTITDACGYSATSSIANLKIVCPQTLTVDSWPQNQILYQGQTASLSIFATGTGLRYYWQTSTGGNHPSWYTIATTSSVNLGIGNYTISVSDICGNSLSKYFKLDCPTITIASSIQNQYIHLGQTATFTWKATGNFSYGTFYYWQYYSSSINNSYSPTITVTAPGTYSFSVRDACNNSAYSSADLWYICDNNLSIISQPKSQTIKPGQSATLSITAIGDGLHYHDWAVDGYSYWPNGNGGSFPDGQLVTVTFPGAYSVYVSDICGNTLRSDFATVTVSNSLSEIENDQPQSGFYTLFPNPASGFLIIKTSGFTQNKRATGYNLLGQEVFTTLLTTDHSNLDISGLPKGIYSVKIDNQSHKLVVE